MGRFSNIGMGIIGVRHFQGIVNTQFVRGLLVVVFSINVAVHLPFCASFASCGFHARWGHICSLIYIYYYYIIVCILIVMLVVTTLPLIGFFKPLRDISRIHCFL